MFSSVSNSIQHPVSFWSVFPLLRTALCALAIALGAATGATAQPAPAAPVAAPAKPAVDVVLAQSKVTRDAQGKEQLVAADAVKPGDVLEYRASYTNKSGKPVKGLVANLPIPEGLEYLPGTAAPGGEKVTAATKDGRFAAVPLSRMVNGKSEPVPYAEYRNLRWPLGELPASGTAIVTLRARVETAAPSGPPAPPGGSAPSGKAPGG